jgi:hypothetical protein
MQSQALHGPATLESFGFPTNQWFRKVADSKQLKSSKNNLFAIVFYFPIVFYYKVTIFALQVY